jgi:hypothetical protein
MLTEWNEFTEMAPYYRSITAASSFFSLDQALLDTMEKANEEELKRLDERLADAEKTEGESEISDALKARANYLTRIGDKVCLLYFFLKFDSYVLDARNARLQPRNSRWRKHQASVPGSTSFLPSYESVCFSATRI